MEKLTIIKAGGKIAEDDAAVQELAFRISNIPHHKILVHGGGQYASAVSEKLGIPAKMNEGRRITCKDTLAVVTMVYAGIMNKTIVATLQKHGCNALGLTGADLDIITAVKRPVKEIDYGFAGDIVSINIPVFEMLFRKGITPVIAPLTHDRNGQLLNTNADTIPAEIAAALCSRYEVSLFYVFEKQGVLSNPEDENTVIKKLTPEIYPAYKNRGIINRGMIPKLDNGFEALKKGVNAVSIGSVEALHNPGCPKTVLSL